MLLKLFLCALVAVFVTSSVATTYTYSPYTFGKLDHFIKKPSQDVLVGGRLTSRQVAGIAESGFQTLVTISDFPDTDSSYNGVTGEFPSSDAEAKIFESYGLTFDYLPLTFNASDAKRFADVVSRATKPVYVHCHGGFEASVFTTLYLFQTNQLPSDQIVATGANLGFNFLSNKDVVELINQVAGTSLVYSSTPLLELTLANTESSYKSYYWPHRLASDNWYNIGQLLETQVSALVAAGYKTVVSLRADGEATTRLSTDPATGAVPNDEFSDADGKYSVALESAAFTNAGIKFYNLPVDSASAWTNTDNFYNAFVPAMKEIESTGVDPAVVHCASGYRSSAYLSTYLALQQGQCTAWALQQASYVGFAFDQSSSDAAVVSFMKSVLKC